ncbi:TonB-dependent receptor [Tardiphaga sp. 42S5]|uniref:TonB-dependent receptor n=1 Tax=Tardiphaga sp. 42S5 TaxID=1404799 RepID=UPI002A5A32C2|nr:TonB-dependent hemoglobin/transferrin/lactoferrin family receptor [Tardiphaga sp. 42S5]WPO39946.1 TonB-dependent hemoglobin/transferrin/lactoferrin family receptor [Tardiphaga sp. 42S5]
MITTVPAFGQNNVEATATTPTTYPLNISAKPLAAAIADLGASSGWRILYTIQLAPDIRSQPLNGTYTVAQALAQLLAGTGITYRITGPKAALLIDPSQSRAGPVPSGDGVQLDTIVVDAARSDNTTGSGYQGTPNWVYQRPAAVSVISREAIESSPTRNARDLLDNVAGVYANRSAAQNPGISVNIRGLQDQDRIATMIDGARQNFQRSGHGATQRTYVDTAFLRQIDVEKSTTSGVGSAGALGGLVNFRTFIADDLIKPGNQYGGVVNATTGTNAYNFDGSTAAAVRVSERFSVLGGVSYKNIGAYDIGKNGTIGGGTTAYDGNVFLFSGQEVFSTILKAEALTTEDVKITIGWLHNDSRYNTGNYDDTIARGGILKSSEQVANDTFTSALDWNPGNDIVNLKAKLYYNHLKNDTVSDGAFALTGPSNFVFSTLGGSVENTSRFETGIGALALNYGLEAFSDTGKTKLQRGFTDANGVDYSSTLTGGTPSGDRDVASGFGTATLKPTEWVTLIGGVRYDWYHIAGNATIYGDPKPPVIGQKMTDPGKPAGCNRRGCWDTILPKYEPIYGPPVYPSYDVEIDKSGGAWLPSFTVAFQPTDWLQPFAKYSKSYRPPTIMESFLNGGHDANEINGYAPNPFLRPERGDTYEAGFNVLANGILTERDTVRFKSVGFYREITDYISFGQIRNTEAAKQYQTYVNLNGVTRMKGVEIEANYDARFLYIGGTVTRIDTDFADSFTTPSGRNMPINSGLGAAVIFEQPKLRVTLDAGIRLFDEKLTLGTRIVDVSKTVPALGSLRSGYEMSGYRVYDIYGSYSFDEATKLRFAVNNVTDLAYAPAVGANFYAAPGRTATVSLNYKF